MSRSKYSLCVRRAMIGSDLEQNSYKDFSGVALGSNIGNSSKLLYTSKRNGSKSKIRDQWNLGLNLRAGKFYFGEYATLRCQGANASDWPSHHKTNHIQNSHLFGGRSAGDVLDRFGNLCCNSLGLGNRLAILVS